MSKNQGWSKAARIARAEVNRDGTQEHSRIQAQVLAIMTISMTMICSKTHWTMLILKLAAARPPDLKLNLNQKNSFTASETAQRKKLKPRRQRWNNSLMTLISQKAQKLHGKITVSKC